MVVHALRWTLQCSPCIFYCSLLKLAVIMNYKILSEINYVDQIVVLTTGPVSLITKCQCQCKTQITDCMLIRLKFCTLDRLNSTPISLYIMQVSPKNMVFTAKTACSSTTKLTIRPQVECIFIGGNLMSFKKNWQTRTLS